MGETTCMNCHFWLPFDLMPRVGQCENPSSRSFGRPEFSDRPAKQCFVERSLEGLDFVWCQTHRQTIYSAEIPAHRGCWLFVGAATLPAEEEAEVTLAGD
jgi:hypothetical protein